MRYRAPTVIFSDGSWRLELPMPCRVGAVLFSERLPKPLGRTALVSRENPAALLIRKQQITQCETLVTGMVLDTAPEALENVDCLWFLDNTGFEAGLISGYSGSPDSACMIGVVHIILAKLNSRPWFKRVPSERNPSDGLSRDGLDDAWTQTQGWDLREVPPPDWSNLKDLPLDTLLGSFAEVVARQPEAEVREAPVEWKLPSVPADVLARLLAIDATSVSQPPPV